MFASKKPRTEIAIRICMIVVVLFNGFAPITASASPQSVSSSELKNQSDSSAPKSLSEQQPIYFNPPELPQPQKKSPDPDEVPSPIPPKDPVEFTLVADPAIVPANGLVTFQAYIRNNSDQRLDGLIFTDTLESGIEYSQNSQSPVSFDSNTNQVTLALNPIEPGEEFSFSYTLFVSLSKRNEINDKIWLHRAELNSDESIVHLETNAAFGVSLSEAATDTEMAPLQLEGGWNDLGRVEIHMQKDNVGEYATVLSTPADISGTGPKLQFNLDVYTTNPLTADSVGEFNEQTVRLTQENTTAFQEPAFLEINLDDYVDLNHIPAGQEPYVATYDEVHDIWVKVPILATDPEQNTVTVEAAHFSTWGAGLGSSLPQNGANVLLFDQPYTSLFTGSSRYSIPVWTPPGRAGMQPDISLSYSSGTVDGVLGDVQAPWVGEGWNMDAVEIVRKITTDENGYGYRNEFALTLNGSLYQLIRSEDPAHLNRYYTDQAAFLYVELHNQMFGNASTANITGEWWEVVTTDGTRYQLGWNNDAEQLALMYGYSCSAQNCSTPDGAYASLGYAGNAKDLVAMRWRVDKVSDTHGNFMEYGYAEASPEASPTIAKFDRESYLASIKYTGFHDPAGKASDVAPGYEIDFARDSRSTVGDVPTEFNIWDNIDADLLTDITVKCLRCTTSPADASIRTYHFDYSLAAVPNANGTLTLSSLEISGGGYTENGQSVPATSAPTIHFAYQNLPNRDITGTSQDAFSYPRLTSIDNGSGGLLTFAYEQDGRGTNSWYNYRVQNAQVDSGMGLAKKQEYTYLDPIYSGPGSLGNLTGYTTVTESVLDFLASDTHIEDIEHTFGTVGLDIGRELETKWLSGSIVLRKTTSSYVTDNSKAPFYGWNYRYLGESANYENSGGVLTLTSKNTYYNDPANGNLLLQSTYLGSSLYRKTYYTYAVNPAPEVYILDKISTAVLMNAGNQVYSDTRYYYDGSLTDVPTRGDVTLVRKLTGNGNQTVDAGTGYDIYGNVTSAQSYKDYGTVDAPPTSDYWESSINYKKDANEAFYAYPIATTDPLGMSTTSNYV